MGLLLRPEEGGGGIGGEEDEARRPEPEQGEGQEQPDHAPALGEQDGAGIGPALVSTDRA